MWASDNEHLRDREPVHVTATWHAEKSHRHGDVETEGRRDMDTRKEIQQVINHTRELRYQTFILTAYSMGLRLGEVLHLHVGDIDSAQMKVHVRLGKGKKDRFVTLPQRTLYALRFYCS